MSSCKKAAERQTFKSWKEGQGDSLGEYSVEEENFCKISTFCTLLTKTRALAAMDVGNMSNQPFQWDLSYTSREKGAENICCINRHRSVRKKTQDRERESYSIM